MSQSVVTMTLPISAKVVTRCRWVVEGTVQGVGFRPFIWRLAHELGLVGTVQNYHGAVIIDVQGDQSALALLAQRLAGDVPPLAQVRQVTCETLIPAPEWCELVILPSVAEQGDADSGAYDIAPDAATCPQCLAELLGGTDRRAGHGLINCTDCGPRYSILRAVPYDRCNTTMSSFAMCPTCAREYASPADRRFHAQPISCRACGPRMELVDPAGNALDEDPIGGAVCRLIAGQVVAIKGLGGFHLAVRADDETAVRRLRSLKKRDHKPFALMVADLAAARELVKLSDAGIAALQSPAGPIVLAARRAGADVAASVAPGTHRLGVMLPYTPIQHLIFDRDGNQLQALVMTSGNQSDDPLVTDNADAVARLGAMCDAILWHDRPIERGVDDSVVIDAGEADPIIIRRARGMVPQAIKLPVDCGEHGVCVGGELKNTIAIVRDGRAILGQHLGDLSHPRALANFKHAIDDLTALFDARPQWLAHDAHPVYLSTQHAKRLAEQRQIPLIEVQHHHAHAAALMAEHGVTGPILAVVCDGVGYGSDGTAWGGELLLADLVGFTRLASIAPMRLSGGDAAAKDTARCGLALLFQAYGNGFEEHAMARRLVPDAARRQVLCRMIAGDINCVISTGMGRVFDGVAAILGLCDFNHHEAQSGMAMEAAAGRAGGLVDVADLFELIDPPAGDGHTAHQMIDFASLVRRIVEKMLAGEDSGVLSAMFHEQVARAWAAAVNRAAVITGVTMIGLTGGVFCNAILLSRITELLNQQHGLRVLRHRRVGPNDGSISLGQAAVAMARLFKAKGVA